MDFGRLFKKHGVKTAPRPGLQPLSETELEKVVGGAKDPSWRLTRVDIQLFVKKSSTYSGEIILPKVKTYEQARNKAFEYIGDALVKDSEPFIGGLESSESCGKIIGRISKDKKIRWRLDFDPEKGIHIHVEDFRLGKGSMSTKIVIPFEGGEQEFMTLLKHLNK